MRVAATFQGKFESTSSSRSPLPGPGKPVDSDPDGAEESELMPALLLCVFRFVRLLMSGHQALALENAALRLQLAAFQRKRKRPLLTAIDRVFWVALRQWWSGWRSPLIYIQPDTVRFWARLSRSHHRRPGRPATAVEIRRLIERWRLPIRSGAHRGSMAN